MAKRVTERSGGPSYGELVKENQWLHERVKELEKFLHPAGNQIVMMRPDHVYMDGKPLGEEWVAMMRPELDPGLNDRFHISP